MNTVHGFFLHSPIDITDKYKCLFCSYTTNTLESIDKHHGLTHHSNLPAIQYEPSIGYYCSLCKRKMVHFTNLSRHIRTVHRKSDSSPLPGMSNYFNTIYLYQNYFIHLKPNSVLL